MKDNTSSNVYHCAVQHKIHPFLFKQLLKLNKNMKAAFNDKNKEEETSLHLALKLHQFTHAKYLLSVNDPISQDVFDDTDSDNKFVDPNLKDKKGKNALHIALDNGAPYQLIMKLLDK